MSYELVPLTNLKGPPGGPGPKGEDGSNVLPTAEAIAASKPVKSLERRSVQPLPMREVVVTARGTDPIPAEFFDGYFWGSDSGTIKRSSDAGDTWATYCTVPNLSGSSIQRILPCDDGEVLVVSTVLAQRSTGWAGGSPTWTTVLTNPTPSYFYPWGIDGDGTKFIIVHYSGSGTQTPDRADSRYGWISVDGGNTFAEKWDSDARWGSTINEQTHLHGAAYDPWEDRFFISEGHVSVTGVYESRDDGDTWVRVPYGKSFDHDPSNAPTVIKPTDSGIVFGTDDVSNGILTIPRGISEIDRVYSRMGISNTVLFGYAHMGARDPQTGVIYMVREMNQTFAGDLPAQIDASDGLVGSCAWVDDDPSRHLWRRITIDDEGNFLAWEQSTNAIAKGKIGGVGTRSTGLDDSGRVLGGTVIGGRNSVAIGAEAVAVGDGSIAFGGGASTSNHFGTAVGANSVSIGSGQSFGNSATSEASGLAVGYQASTTNGTAIGSNAFAPQASATAIGRSAQAAVDGSSANINSTAVGYEAKASGSAGDCVAIGHGATASDSRSTAIGASALASIANSLAVGQGAEASGSFYATALGFEAKASHANSIALGKTVTTAEDQLSLDARHIELVEMGYDPAEPEAGTARIYVKDDGAGNTILCVRTSSGIKTVTMT